MKNVNEYKKRFYNLMESEMGDVRPLIVEQAENNYWKDIKNEFINKGNPVLIDTEGIKSLNWGTHSSNKNNLKYGMSVSWTPDKKDGKVLGFTYSIVDREEHLRKYQLSSKESNESNPEIGAEILARDEAYNKIANLIPDKSDPYGEPHLAAGGVKYRSYYLNGPNNEETYQDIVKLLNAGLETSLD